MAKEKNISKTDTQKSIHVDVPIPQEINVNKNYKVMFFENHSGVKLVGNRIMGNANLERSSGLRICGWYVSEGGDNTAQSFFMKVSEALFVYNSTDKPIKVKIKGFETSQKWYYTEGNVSVNADADMSVNGITTSGEVESDEIEIKSGEADFFWSSYIPTGKEIKDARLVLDIDGKTVKTNTFSSKVTVENGQHYRMYVNWDGNKLEWY